MIMHSKKKSKKNPNAVIITFKEGINMRKIASLIEENTKHKKEEVFNLLKDQNYLNELINTYWFLTDDIKNPSIYYSLEGYLFPNTYEFSSKDVDLKEIFKKMLDNMEEKLEPYKTQIASSNYNIHQLLTLASIVELEAARSDDRNGVAGVFYNRLKAGWSLGSDVTTYYAIQIDMNERDLYQNELESYNAYNTRSSQMAGKLPVGPICIPSKESIDAAINPKSHNYFYFVADKNAKENNIPIMQKDGIDFMCEYIKKNNIKNILEVGAAIGYSAIRMASISNNIKVTTIERDEKRYKEAVKNIESFNLEQQINIIFNDAFDVELNEQYDLIFIDAAKSQYIKFFEKFKKNLKEDGTIISDNLKFHGLVNGTEENLSRNVRGLVRKLKKYIKFLEDNEEFKTEFIDIGDGISISKFDKI